MHAGNYSSYITAREQAARAAQESRGKSSRGGAPTARPLVKPRRRTAQLDALSVDQIEARIMAHEARIAELNERFGDPAVYQDAATLAELRAELDAAHAELEILEEAWGERADNN